MNIIGIAGQLGSGKDHAADRLCREHGFVKIAQADPMKRFGAEVFGFTEEQLWGPSEFRNAKDDRFHYETSPAWVAALDMLYEVGGEWLENDVDAEGEFSDRFEVGLQSLSTWFLQLYKNYCGALSPRIMLQTLGTEWGRKCIDDDLWSHCALDKAEVVLSGNWSYDAAEGLCIGGAFDGVIISDVRFPNELENIQARGGKAVRIKRPATDGRATSVGVAGHASETSMDDMPDEKFDYIIDNDSTLEVFNQRIDLLAQLLLGSE